MIKTNLVESKNERNINNRINFVQSIVIVVILTVVNNISAAQYADNEIIVTPFNDQTWMESNVSENNKNITQSALKYLDNKLNEEIQKQKQTKNSNSVLYRAAKVQSALNPTSKIGMNNNVKVQFKANVLQGKVRMIVENPVVELNSEIKINGNVKVNASKNFSNVGLVASMQYNVNENSSTTSLTKNLISNLSASIVSAQSVESTEKIVSLDYSVAF